MTGHDRWPDAVLVAGVAGSGKTTLATGFAAATDYCLFDLDEVTGPLTEAALALLGEASDALDGPLGRELRSARYGCVLDAARANLAVAHRVVCAAPFTDECRDAGALAAATDRLGRGLETAPRVLLAYVDTPAALVSERLARRGAPRDHAKIATGSRAAGLTRPAVPHLRIDGALETEAQVESLLDALCSSATSEPRSSAC